MKNIWFTIYTGDQEKYDKIGNYRTLLEILMIPAIQNKLNRDKKMSKVMYCLSERLEADNIENFRKNYYEKKVWEGLVNLDVSFKNINWNSFSDQEKKDFLIEKWKVLFSNLSDDYFIVDKSEVINSLDKLRTEEWKHTSLLFKKKLKYNKELYSIVMDISVEKAKLALVRESDESWFILKEYEEVWKIMMDANFKNFKLAGDILTLDNKTFFLPSEVIDLRNFIK